MLDAEVRRSGSAAYTHGPIGGLLVDYTACWGE